MNELTQKYRAKNGKAQFEIFAERDGCLYGLACDKLDSNNWHACRWWNDGESSLHSYYDIEEVPETPEHDLKVDDLVWVWDSQDKTDKRIACFAGFNDNGYIRTWPNGKLSQCGEVELIWQYWEKYQPEPVQTSEPATPKWHEYLKTHDEVICYVWNDDDDDDQFYIDAISHIENSDGEYCGYESWQHAEPIPTQCGKYCTAVKDGKTILLPLE